MNTGRVCWDIMHTLNKWYVRVIEGQLLAPMLAEEARLDWDGIRVSA